MNAQEKPVMSVTEVANMLGVSKPTVYDITERGDFPALVRIGKRKLILRHKFMEWLELQAAPAIVQKGGGHNESINHKNTLAGNP